MSRIADAHVVVTGGSQGIGLATARACAAHGARVSLIGRDPAKLAAARDDVAEVVAVGGGGGVEVAAADVTDEAALGAALAGLVEAQGPCDILVASAGQAHPGYFLDLDTDVFVREMELNYLGVLHAVRAVLPAMVARGRGHLVLLSSFSGLVGVFGYGAYTPTKFAVRGLGEALHAEFVDRGIVTSIVYPPDTDTPGFERENLTKPPETAHLSAGIPPLSASRVADAIVRGIERDRLHVTAEWQSRLVAAIADVHGRPLRALMRRQLRRLRRA